MSKEWEIVKGKDKIDKGINKIVSDMKDSPISGKKAERDAKGKFLPGHNFGKIQKKKAYNVDELRKAIEDVEKGKKHTLLKHFIRKAYTSEQVLIALIKKLVPDISITELNNSGSPFNLFVTQFIQEKAKEKEKEKEINERPKPETLINKGQNGSAPLGE